MALERTGLSSELTFNAKSAIANMGRATQAFNAMNAAANRGSLTQIADVSKIRNQSMNSKILGGNLAAAQGGLASVGSAAKKMGSFVSRAGVAVTNLGRSLGFAALAAAPFTMLLKNMTGDAANFDQAIANLHAVEPGASPQEMQIMEQEIRRLGRTTAFSSVEVADAFTAMRKSGIELQDTLKLGEPVTSLAVAGDMKLADASQLLAKVVQQTGSTYDQAGDLIDKLAVAARDSTSDVGQLGMAMSYSAGTARSLNVPIDQTIAALAVIGKTTREGSRAGTTYNQMLTAMSKKSKEVGGKPMLAIGGMMVGIRHFKNGSIDLINTISDIDAALKDKYHDPMLRNAAVTKVFNQQGARGFNALALDIDEFCKIIRTVENDFKGVAKQMAELRLNSFLGQVKLLNNAFTDLAISLFLPALRAATPYIKQAAKFISDVVGAVELLNMDAGGGVLGEKAYKRFEKLPKSVRAVAIAFKDLSVWIKDTLVNALDTVSNAFKKFMSITGLSQRDLIIFAGKAAIVIGVLAPLAAMLSIVIIAGGSLLSALGSWISALGSLATMVGELLAGGMSLAALGEAALFLGGAMLVGLFSFLAFKKEGESTTEALLRLWHDGISPIIDGFTTTFAPALLWVGMCWDYISGEATKALDSIKGVFKPWVTAIFGTKTGMEELGNSFGYVAALIVIAVTTIITTILRVQLAVIRVIAAVWSAVSGVIVGLVLSITEAVALVTDGKLGAGLIKLGTTMLKVLISPFTEFVRLLFDAAEAVLGIKIPDNVRNFVDSLSLSQQVKEAEMATTVTNDVTANKAEEKKQEKGYFEQMIEDMKDALAGQKQEVNVNSCLHLDGREIHKSTSRYEKEMQARSAWKDTPYQRRMYAEYGCTSTSKVS